MNATEYPEHLKHPGKRKAWYDNQRNRLVRRIEHAKDADDRWPNTDRRCDLFHLERELEQLDHNFKLL